MIKLLVTLFIFFSIIIVLVFYFQKNLIFFPDKTPFSTCYYNDRIEIVNENGLRYYKWKSSESKGTLIHFHGNGGRACDRLYLLEHFKNLSLDVLFVEYPGYAEDRKLPSQKELLENAKQLYLSLPSDKPIFLYGESLGAAVATHLAMLYPIKGLILQSPFTSVRALAQKIYPFLPIKWIIRYPLEQDQWAKTVNASVLILHGVRDEIVPYEMGKELNTFFRNSRLSSYETKGHNDITLNNPKMFEDVKRFINQTISPSP